MVGVGPWEGVGEGVRGLPSTATAQHTGSRTNHGIHRTLAKIMLKASNHNGCVVDGLDLHSSGGGRRERSVVVAGLPCWQRSDKHNMRRPRRRAKRTSSWRETEEHV